MTDLPVFPVSIAVLVALWLTVDVTRQAIEEEPESRRMLVALWTIAVSTRGWMVASEYEEEA